LLRLLLCTVTQLHLPPQPTCLRELALGQSQALSGKGRLVEMEGGGRFLAALTLAAKSWFPRPEALALLGSLVKFGFSAPIPYVFNQKVSGVGPTNLFSLVYQKTLQHTKSENFSRPELFCVPNLVRHL
jgi:hypothetical protein